MSGKLPPTSGFPDIEKYEVLDEIGHGGMATVYRALDLRLEREVALKVIHKHLREHGEVRSRFVAEARAVAKLRHPGIVEVYDVSEESAIERYLVVELIRGLSLREYLQRCEQLPPEIGAVIVSLLCEAVEHAHECGVIHRDIKPENVLLELPDEAVQAASSKSSTVRSPVLRDDDSAPGEGGTRMSRSTPVRVKLTDFGIAKLLDAQGATSTGQILGSPAHMAPEQIEGGEIGPHTDVFALGVMLYECMVGELPFAGRNPAQVLRKVLSGAFEPADRARPEVGTRWARIIAAALQLDPVDRLRNAADLGALIVAELEALGLGDRQAALRAYFDAPDSFHAELVESLVPRLLERGEAARRAGKVADAAADFNRALALRPDDLGILRRVSSLTSRERWKQRASRLGGICGTCLLLGGGAFLISRWFRGSVAVAALATSPFAERLEPTALQVPSAAPTASSADVVATAQPSATAPARNGLPSARPRHSGAMAASSRAVEVAPSATVRKVRFHVTPGTAKLTIDGRELGSWWVIQELSVGAHQIQASVPNHPCCRAVQRVVIVKAAEADGPAVQTIPISLPIKAASFVLVGAPPGESVVCQGRSAPGSVPMTKTENAVSCRFSHGVTTSVTLRAGDLTRLSWPR